MNKKDRKEIYPFIDNRITDYCSEMHSNTNESLNELIRLTHLRFVKPHMVSGAWQGAFLQMICRILRPKRILEIGTFSGYATLCFALSTTEDCRIDTVEAMREYEDFLSSVFERNGVKDKIRLHFGQGLEVIETLEDKYDLIFIDAEKIHYPQYYDLCVQRLNKGGILLADNILWYGKVALTSQKDKETEAIREFNEKITADERMDNLILPIRDGIMVGRKKDY
ncbi:MAG: class I SAM-dependent methyltransferase [Bacteroidales bacterium]|nr:class I SAM-dependent methyltransferase [Bacteroidales bacterium]